MCGRQTNKVLESGEACKGTTAARTYCYCYWTAAKSPPNFRICIKLYDAATKGDKFSSPPTQLLLLSFNLIFTFLILSLQEASSPSSYREISKNVSSYYIYTIFQLDLTGRAKNSISGFWLRTLFPFAGGAIIYPLATLCTVVNCCLYFQYTTPHTLSF